MKAVITKLLNKAKFIMAIRELHSDLSLQERKDIAENLHNKNEFYVYGKDHAAALFADNAEYFIAESEWEQEYRLRRLEYEEAEKWYHNLPEEDRKKVDLLIQSNCPS